MAVLSSDGTHQWSRRTGGLGTDLGGSVAVDSAGNVIVGGYINGTVDFNGDGDTLDDFEITTDPYAGYDNFVSAFDLNGIHQWSRRIGGLNTDYGSHVTADSLDRVIVSGRIVNTADLNSNGTTTDSDEVVVAPYGGSDYYVSVFTTDYSPAITVTAVASEEIESITGTASDLKGSVSVVEYRLDAVDSDPWIACISDDGLFDEASEAFSCVFGRISDGVHVIQVRSTDNNTNTTVVGSESIVNIQISFPRSNSTQTRGVLRKKVISEVSNQEEEGEEILVVKEDSSQEKIEAEKIATLQESITDLQGKIANLKLILQQSESSKIKFKNTLKLGDKHPDVKLLQEFLNIHNFPLVQTGLGSRGRETDFFGYLTQQAVKRLQTAYAKDILLPANLTIATGYFGENTMKKVNEMQ